MTSLRRNEDEHAVVSGALQPTKRQSRRLAKEKRILVAAMKVFAEHGFKGASMDFIALKAKVSKPTLYEFFGSKEQLFTEMMKTGLVMLAPFEAPSQEGMVKDLHAFAWAYADVVMKPAFLAIARLVIGEAQRFPEIGHIYQAAGPDRTLRGIMDYMNKQRREGRVKFSDAELAAQDFWSLILSAPRTKALHFPDQIPNRVEIKRSIDNGLKVFLAAYSTQPAADIAALETLTKQKKQI